MPSIHEEFPSVATGDPTLSPGNLVSPFERVDVQSEFDKLNRDRIVELPDFSILKDPVESKEKQPQGYDYPFPSIDRQFRESTGKQEGKDYIRWTKEGFDLQETIANISKPIVELGGPTEDGYLMLEGVKLPSKPHITNVRRESVLSSQLIDELVDASQMPYEDRSLGLVLMQGLDYTEKHAEIVNTPKDDRATKQAKMELEQVASGALKPEAAQGMRMKIYKEALRILTDGGLLIANGGINDIRALEKMDFELVSYDQEHLAKEEGLYTGDGDSYEFVMIKRAEDSTP